MDPDPTEDASRGASETAVSRLPDWFWARHSNPWSGGTRFAATPLLIYALYRRRFRLLAATIVFVAVNPVLFPEPESTDNWLSQAVLAEKWWFERGNATFEPTYPSAINYVSVPAFAAALYGAIRRKPVVAAAGTAATILTKVWFVDALVRRYRASNAESADADG